MNTLTLNAGSSSIKFALYLNDAPEPNLHGRIECIDTSSATLSISDGLEAHFSELGRTDHGKAISVILEELGSRSVASIDRIGHRVVHGGDQFGEPTLVSDGVLEKLRGLCALAPLHNPASVKGIEASLKHFPEVPQIAVFDTAFHSDMPEVNYRYAVPRAWYQDHKIRRYGFHGISHGYVAERAVEFLGLDPNDHRLLIAHLGNGCSATAVENGRSIDTTMGFTPLEGLVMGTRSGSIDPGILSHIARETGMDFDQIDTALNRESGLLGLSGANDMRELRQRMEDGDEAAMLALNVFEHRLCKELAALTASLQSLPDVLVFTGGIGENQVKLRSSIMRKLAWMGFIENIESNAVASSDCRIISEPGSRLVAVIPTNEEFAIARFCREISI